MATHRFSDTWPARPDSVPVARRSVLAFLRDARTADPPLNDIGLAVSEAVSNVVNHAYVGADPGEVRVAVEVEPEAVAITVEDDGRGMTPRPDSPGIGLGLPLIATLADRFDVSSRPGDGTRLCLRFPLAPSPALH